MILKDILAGESKNIEFKETLPKQSIKYIKSVVAFANSEGGKTSVKEVKMSLNLRNLMKENVIQKRIEYIRKL